MSEFFDESKEYPALINTLISEAKTLDKKSLESVIEVKFSQALKAKEQLENLKGSDAHFTVILSEEDEKILRRLGINVSFEPRYEHQRLYHK